MFKRIYVLLILGAALACNASPVGSSNFDLSELHLEDGITPVKKSARVDGSNDLQPDEKQSLVSRVVAQMITNNNYKKVKLNDSLSAVIFNRYVKSLDDNHDYFLASDIEGFQQYKTKLDDDLKSGDLSNVFYMYNVFQKRYVERVKFSIAQLDKDYDFTKDEVFAYNREKLPYAKSTGESDELWAKRVKYDLLSLKLATPDLAKDKETLRKRYQNLLNQSEKLSAADVFQKYMEAVTEAVDPHTNYFTPFNASQFNMEMSRSLEGIGATLTTENDMVTIQSIVPGGPAYKSKQIDVGDHIVGVAQGKDGEYQDIIGWRLDNAIGLIRGHKGTLVKLKVIPKGKATSDQPKIVEIVREKIILQDQSVKKEIKTYNNNGKITKIGIINIPAFYIDFNAYRAGDPNYKSTTRDVKLILDTLKQMNVDGIVVDLRENGGGSLSEAISLTGLFIKSGPVVQVRDSQNRIEVDEDDDTSVSYAGPMAVLVDRFSASASEIFSGAIQDYGRGIIIGTQTYGKGSVQNEIDLDNVISPVMKQRVLDAMSARLKAAPGKAITGKVDSTGKIVAAPTNQSTFGQLNLTIAKFYRVNGSSTQHKGVTPDIAFPSLIPMEKYGEDTEPSAMPWDTIAASNYTKVGNFTTVLPKLTQLYKARQVNNPTYKYLMDIQADYKKQDTEKSVSLNEVALKKQRDADSEKNLARENTIRVAMGYPALKKGDKKPKNEDIDFIKKEAGQILTDYIMLDNKITKVNGTH
ncbi:carboxy terminal-processing peptidase [Mucilaginibacter sp. HMF5004]|uniref:carboxy terminal-processing peptidase n=1 Tax=Mucilaginibacter rivuli TaxID=2857527 RepID=UPI001C6061BE|nr:carboxy terminal-processing peptidase [Mucilaginibacter rivuli]MBW4888280.1 carboxy terminal-processing peptidase [Mucilaginibacter rivuli]